MKKKEKQNETANRKRQPEYMITIFEYSVGMFVISYVHRLTGAANRT